MPSDSFRVQVEGALNLRSEPVVRPGNRLAQLPPGHLVRKVEEASDPEWWKVTTVITGNALTGFVAHRFLVPDDDFERPPEESGVREVHLRENRPEVTRQNQSLLAFPIGEADRPSRDGGDPTAHREQLLDIVEYLKVDASPRYAPRNGDTFCNIYAYDYCYLANAYLPRVWWSGSAIERLARGEMVAVQPGVTVFELNANSLFNWLKDFGPRFGWIRVLSLDELQNAANEGRVAILSAQRVALNTPGHILAVVPENGSNQATRKAGSVSVALQSQAGASNFRFSSATGRWWTAAKFREAAFWVHL
jgi:hypothetical protein